MPLRSFRPRKKRAIAFEQKETWLHSVLGGTLTYFSFQPEAGRRRSRTMPGIP